jgi:hypothetical protein
MLDQNEKDFILLLASSSASLDKSPKHNWVEDAGGLPPYVRKLARGIMKSGHDLASAISIAISRIKVWAAGGGDVNAETRAKAAKALAQWEKAKAKSHVKLSYPDDGIEYLVLSSSYNTEIVRAAWDSIQRERRDQYNAAQPAQLDSNQPTDISGYPYQWLTELGSDYIIVSSDYDRGTQKYRLSYTVDENEEVTFGAPKKIIQIWIEDDDELSNDEKAALSNIPTPDSAMGNILKLSHGLKK